MTDPFMTELVQASDLLKAEASWTLFTHQKPDGDAMGSATALLEAGALAGKQVSWVGPDPELPSSYAFLAHRDSYRAFEGAFPFDDPKELYVFLDCSNEARGIEGLDEGAVSVKGLKILNIDHHEDNSRFGSVNCVDPSSSSTAELVFRILKAGGWRLSQALAESVYTGIWTDTGGFAFSCTSARTHRVAAELLDLGVDPGRLDDLINQIYTPGGIALRARALSRVRVFGPENLFAISWLSLEDFAETHALPEDTEGLSGVPMQIRGVRLAVFLTERKGGKIKASFRSREGVFPAAEIARKLGGGGHPRAAGATLKGGTLEEHLKNIPELLEARYAEWTAAH